MAETVDPARIGPTAAPRVESARVAPPSPEPGYDFYFDSDYCHFHQSLHTTHYRGRPLAATIGGIVLPNRYPYPVCRCLDIVNSLCGSKSVRRGLGAARIKEYDIPRAPSGRTQQKAMGTTPVSVHPLSWHTGADDRGQEGPP